MIVRTDKSIVTQLDRIGLAAMRTKRHMYEQPVALHRVVETIDKMDALIYSLLELPRAIIADPAEHNDLALAEACRTLMALSTNEGERERAKDLLCVVEAEALWPSEKGKHDLCSS